MRCLFQPRFHARIPAGSTSQPPPNKMRRLLLKKLCLHTWPPAQLPKDPDSAGGACMDCARVRPSVRCYTSGGLRIVTSGLLLTCCGEFGVDFRCNGKAVSSPPLDDVVWRRVGSGVVLVDRGLVVFWWRTRPMCTRTSFLEFRFLRQNVPESTRVKNRQLWFLLLKGGTAKENRRDNILGYTT